MIATLSAQLGFGVSVCGRGYMVLLSAEWKQLHHTVMTPFCVHILVSLPVLGRLLSVRVTLRCQPGPTVRLYVVLMVLFLMTGGEQT